MVQRLMRATHKHKHDKYIVLCQLGNNGNEQLLVEYYDSKGELYHTYNGEAPNGSTLTRQHMNRNAMCCFARDVLKNNLNVTRES